MTRALPRVGGLRTRLVLSFVAIAVLIAGTTAGAVSFLARSWIYAGAQDLAIVQFRHEIDEISADVGEQFDPAVITRLRQSGMTVIADRSAVHDGPLDVPAHAVRAFALTYQNRNVASFVDEVRFQRLDSASISLRTVLRFVDSAGEPVHVEAGDIRPLVGVQDKFDELLRVAGLTLAAGVLAGVLLGTWIASTLVKPLRRLDDAAARATDGDLSVRLPENGVSELARLTTTFNNMVARNESVIEGLKASEEQSKRFVADVSHELRTPLAALVPVSEILHEEIPNLPRDTATAARIVHSEIGNLTRLVDDLIEVSRHDAKQAQLVPDHVDLVALVRRALHGRGWSDRVTLSAPERLDVLVDPRRIDIVTANLVGNALRHGAPPVHVDLRAEPGWTVLTVTDHGPGIAPEHGEAVFRRFYKVDTARGRSEGSGLGLSLAAENVHLHGGTIGVERVDGRTVFTVRLPDVDGTVDGPGDDAEEPAETDTALGWRA